MGSEVNVQGTVAPKNAAHCSTLPTRCQPSPSLVYYLYNAIIAWGHLTGTQATRDTLLNHIVNILQLRALRARHREFCG